MLGNFIVSLIKGSKPIISMIEEVVLEHNAYKDLQGKFKDLSDRVVELEEAIGGKEIFEVVMKEQDSSIAQDKIYSTPSFHMRPPEGASGFPELSAALNQMVQDVKIDHYTPLVNTDAYGNTVGVVPKVVENVER